MSKKSKEKTVGYAFIGRWNDGTLGWGMPDVLSGNPRRFLDGTGRLFEENSMNGDRAFLCKVTIEQVFKSNGAAITRRVKKSKAEAALTAKKEEA